MKSEHNKTNAWRQPRSQLHLSAGSATKRGLHVTEYSKLHGAPEIVLHT